MNNDKQYTNINQITKEFLNEWEQEQKPFVTHKQNSKDFINDAMFEFLNEWVKNHFIYTRDILNLLFNNIVNVNEVDTIIKDFNIFVSIEEAILFALVEKLEEAILI